jgi:hypothetical protein
VASWAPQKDAAVAILVEDPVWDAILRAPIDSTPLPEQVLRDIEEGEASPCYLDGNEVSVELAALCR